MSIALVVHATSLHWLLCYVVCNLHSLSGSRRRTYLAAGLSKQALPTLVSKLWCYACLVHSPESWGLSTSSLAEWIHFFALSFILAPASHVWSAYFVLRRVRAHYWRAEPSPPCMYCLHWFDWLVPPANFVVEFSVCTRLSTLTKYPV